MKSPHTFPILLILALVTSFSPASAQQAFVIYSGGIEGGSTVSGYENASDVVGYLHEVTIPFDEGGRITGTRSHAPVHFTKLVDRASIPLMQAAATGEALPEVRFEFTRPDDDGRREVYYVVTLENVRLARVGSFLANPGSLEDFSMPETPGAGTDLFETVSAIYDRITWRISDAEKGDLEYSDSWKAATTSQRADDGRVGSDIVASVFPNPFNVSARLVVDLTAVPDAADVEIAIFDALGRRVREARLDGGARSRQYVWDATDDAGRAVPSGIYFYRVRSGEASASGGMTLVK